MSEPIQLKPNGSKDGEGIINSGGLIYALKNPDGANLIKVVCGLILRENKFPEILSLFNEKKEIYELPGGKIDRDSYPKQALAREIKEEMGMDVLIDNDFRARYTINIRPKERRNFDVYYCTYTSLPEKPLESQFPNWNFIKIQDVISRTRIDISPLIYKLCEDLIPYIKAEGISLKTL